MQNEMNDQNLTQISLQFDSQAPSYVFRSWLSDPKVRSFLEDWEQVHNPNYDPKHYKTLAALYEEKRSAVSAAQYMQTVKSLGLTLRHGKGLFAHPQIADAFLHWRQTHSFRTLRSWENCYEIAAEYCKQYGHLLPGRQFHYQGLNLGSWIRTQRERYAKRHLTQEQIEQLSELNMVWNYPAYHWDRMLKRAKCYYEQHGDLNIPPGTMAAFPDGEFNLYGWLQHKRQTRGALSLYHRQQLESIGTVWNQNEIRWPQNWTLGFQHARAYFQREGHLRIQESYIDEEGYHLGRWIRAQRVKYKEQKLPPESIEQLEHIGMLWRADEQIQTSFAEQALFFYVRLLFPEARNRDKKLAGCELDIGIPSLRVGIEYDGPRFHEPAKDQRKNRKCQNSVFLIRVRDHQLPIIGPSNSQVHYLRLPPGNDIGAGIQMTLSLLNRRFGVDTSQIDVDAARDKRKIYDQMASYVDSLWSGKWKDAEDYWKEHGNIDIPYGYYKNGYDLGSWITEQRKSYRLERLPQYKIDALNALGIKWRYKTETWLKQYRKAKQYYRKHGHLHPAKGKTKESRALYYWINDQLKFYRKGSLSPRKTRLLESIGMIWEDKLDLRFEVMLDKLRRFYQEHGHSIVPLNDGKNGDLPLGLWAQRMRMQITAGTLSDARAKELENLGFHPNNKDAKFQRWLTLAAEYRREHGDLLVPQAYEKAGKKLGKWINALRVRYGKGLLSESQIQQTEALGMVWNTKQTSSSPSIREP